MALLVPFCMAHAQVANGPDERKNYEFAHGQWFDGQKFVAKKFYTVGGKLTSKKPARVDSVIDLSGKYVVPPFGEAHNHNVAQGSRLDAFIRQYLEAGIFYVKNPNSLPRATTRGGDVRAALLARARHGTGAQRVHGRGRGARAAGG